MNRLAWHGAGFSTAAWELGVGWAKQGTDQGRVVDVCRSLWVQRGAMGIGREAESGMVDRWSREYGGGGGARSLPVPGTWFVAFRMLRCHSMIGWFSSFILYIETVPVSSLLTHGLMLCCG